MQDNYEKPLNSDGSKNPKYVDLLEEDKPLAGQKFGCVSFVSPENVLKQKNIFLFEQFLKKWEVSKSMEKFTQFLNYISYKYNVDFDKMMADLEEFSKEEKKTINHSTLSDDYKNFMDQYEDDLEKEFNVANEFQTTVRGVKLRGNFPTQEEAELRCKMLREADPNHDVYVGPIGMWMPWEPDAYKTGRVEHLEPELNQLMHEKKKNETKAKDAFDARVKESKQKAIEDNIKKAEESGNKLTQTITKDGDLVNVAATDTDFTGSKEEISVADIRKELFEGDNVVMGDSDHGLSDLENVTFELGENKKK